MKKPKTFSFDTLSLHAGQRADPATGARATPIYRREALLADHVIHGPAIVDQLDSTTVILPGQSARTDRFGNLIVTEGAS